MRKRKLPSGEVLVSQNVCLGGGSWNMYSFTNRDDNVGTTVIGQCLGEIKIDQIRLRLLVGSNPCRNKSYPLFDLENVSVLSDTSTTSRPSCVWLCSTFGLTH